MKSITEEIERLSDLGLKRTLLRVDGPQGPRVIIEGQERILLCSNDYLGLASHPALKEAAVKAVEAYGVGSGASRLVSGSMAPHMELEERIRAFKGTEDALLFNSGYNANIGILTALADRSTDVFSDRFNHASIVDACILSRARVRRYAHADAGSLERMLKSSTAAKKLVVTEGIFSMDGDIAPLEEIIWLVEKYDATLILDDAHATGVLGNGGRGTLEHLGLEENPFIIQVGTLGKALGTFGAFVAGGEDVIELLRSKARTFVYTTSLPPAVCAASITAFDMVEQNPFLRKRLWENVRYFKEGLGRLALATVSSTQIIPVVVGSAEETMEISLRLLEKGVFIQGIRPPTVPDNTSRLRVTVTAAHTKEDLDTALSAIKEVFPG